MRRILHVVIALAGVLSLPNTVFAQSTIAGVVRDPSAAVLPGVTVEASQPGAHREEPHRRQRRDRTVPASPICRPAATC